MSYVTTLYEPPPTYRMGEISGGQPVVAGGRLVGTVPDATGSATLLLQFTLRRH